MSRFDPERFSVRRFGAARLTRLTCVMMLTAACSTFNARWFEVPSRGLTDEDVYEACLLAMQLENFKVEKGDVKTGLIESHWVVSLVPFYRPRGQGGAGFRRRAVIEIETMHDAPPELGPFIKKIRVRVERERNREEKYPGDIRYAKWEPDSDDTNVAQQIAVRIQERTMPFQPSDDFYRRHGRDGAGAETKPKTP